ncbi:MAG: xanthine dehydrogenase family protein subunit M [Anaerolineales bacterium]|nr:xanthine dehydrogenase family protein subunit M [Anaerolineales bacterium]
MKPAPFEYAAPASLDAALALKAEHGDEAKFLAGGQSLIPAMNFRLVQAGLLVDLNRVPGLAARAVVDGELRLGAMARQRALERDPLVARHAPLLAEALPHVAHPQIRNRGTLGGSLAHADPAAELPVIAVALDARLRARSLSGERWIPASEFFLGLLTTALTPDELLVEVALPPLPPRTGTSFHEFARRSGDYALLGVAAVVTLDPAEVCTAARLVYLNAGDGPLSATAAAGLLVGQTLTAEALTAAADHAATREMEPLGNVHATPEYQRHLARVLSRRALAAARDRARARQESAV